jgi:hypothetical protein
VGGRSNTSWSQRRKWEDRLKMTAPTCDLTLSEWGTHAIKLKSSNQIITAWIWETKMGAKQGDAI